MVKNKHKHFGAKKNMNNEELKEEMAPAEENNQQEEKVTTENLSGNEENSAKTDNVAQEKNMEEVYKQQVAEIQDKYMRMVAEFDNFRKRTLKERSELLKSAGEDVLLGILPVVDDFERGLNAIEKTNDIDALKQGVSLIYNKFREFLIQKGVKEIDAVNQEFNVDVHEAITKIPAPDESMKGKVVDVVQKGYLLNEKVIRFAKVVVGE
jgi:molecular chaperone GrpE